MQTLAKRARRSVPHFLKPHYKIKLHLDQKVKQHKLITGAPGARLRREFSRPRRKLRGYLDGLAALGRGRPQASRSPTWAPCNRVIKCSTADAPHRSFAR